MGMFAAKLMALQFEFNSKHRRREAAELSRGSIELVFAKRREESPLKAPTLLELEDPSGIASSIQMTRSREAMANGDGPGATFTEWKL